MTNSLDFVPHKRRPRTRVVNGHAVVYTSSEDKRDECKIAKSYKGKKLDGPISMRIDVYRHLPKSSKLVEESDTHKPDVDNIAKSIMDALSGIAYDDDSQIVDLRVVKHNREHWTCRPVYYTVENAKKFI